MQRPNPRSAAAPPGLSLLAVAGLAFGAAGFGFGAFFYLVPFQRKSAEVQRLSRDLHATRSVVVVPTDGGDERTRSALEALATEIESSLGPSGAILAPGQHRLRVRFPEDKLFDARGPWLTKPGQQTLETLGQLLGDRVSRVVIAAPMGGATVPRWIRAQLPTPADLSAARAGNALKSVVKGGVRAETVFAVIGSLANDAPDAPATLDLEIEP